MLLEMISKTCFNCQFLLTNIKNNCKFLSYSCFYFLPFPWVVLNFYIYVDVANFGPPIHPWERWWKRRREEEKSTMTYDHKKKNCIIVSGSNDRVRVNVKIFVCLRRLPVMAAVAVRKKVVSIGHFSPSSVTEIL